MSAPSFINIQTGKLFSNYYRTIDQQRMGFVKSVCANQGACAALVCLMVFAWILFRTQRAGSPKMTKLPPGPPSLPIIGSLHLLGKFPHRTLRNLSQKYGDLMFMRLGSVPTLVVGSADMAKEILKTYDLVFASRPVSSAGKCIGYNCTDVALAPYGYYWRQIRKVCMLHLFSAKRVDSFQSVRAEEISLMINSIVQKSDQGSNPVNISKAVSCLTTDVICRIAFGRKYTVEGLNSRGFKGFLQEHSYLVGAFNIGDFIPYLEWMDLQGLKRRFMKVHKTFDALFEKIIEEHERHNGLQGDLVDVLVTISRDNDLGIEITRDNIKAVILDMLVAGTDTSAGVLEWGISELLRNPSAMKKAQEELEKVIGLDRMVQESDLPHLQYLHAVVKETLRLYPPAPLLLPHESVEACNVSGYDIPAKARVIVNAWAIGRDPKFWEDADLFKPERFIGSPIDVKGQNFQLIPFGSGRRSCPAIQLGIVVVELALAQLLHCFDWRLPSGMSPPDLDMSESFGLTVPRAAHLHAIPTLRLPRLRC